MGKVRAKKHLGQHFLTDKNIAKNIADAFVGDIDGRVLEIGPGMGVLTQFLLKKYKDKLSVIEIDRESVAYLKDNYFDLTKNIIEGDFLKVDLAKISPDNLYIIGNFPYNISSQILFKTIENRNKIPQLVGMFQKEVAERIASQPGTKAYGILSVLLQTYYNVEYLFTVHEHVFSPPPKVKSAVIRVKRNNRETLPCDEKLFFRIVKTSFNQRRKTLSNSLKTILLNLKTQNEIFKKRPEQLSVEQFIELTVLIEKLLSQNI
jgi:16S rRNA (adenine1518-N6/adenine1519-N6)-dimethyltransferase